MPTVHVVLCGTLLLFAALQYNDPDWYYWGCIYLLAAVWSLLAGLAPQLLRASALVRIAAPLSIVLFLLGFVSLASQLGPGWIHNEEARESLGYLICAATTTLAVWDARRRGSAQTGKAAT
ncbi:MAG TPA: transmembrane 220 family protein [Hyphomicrobiaceae bacterium]|nr:transmembrane 220 family protein [Hyphomicrobiaceae bacterium]